jgi:hypothetical protein
MKMIAEYLEHALSFERMAAEEKNPEIKAVFEKQATTYRKLAAERAKKLGLDDPRYSSGAWGMAGTVQAASGTTRFINAGFGTVVPTS